MYNCDYYCDQKLCHPPGPQWRKEVKRCLRRPPRMLNLDVQTPHVSITYPRMERRLDLDHMDGLEKAANVADLRRVRSARERSRARPLAV